MTDRVLIYPHGTLRQRAVPVTAFDRVLEQLVRELHAILRRASGYGLAAPQIGVNKAVFVIDPATCGDSTLPAVFVNPEITAREGHYQREESCLSFPSVRVEIQRAATITIKAESVLGGPAFVVTARDLAAAVIQHEMDHLRGKLIIDYVPKGRRTQLLKAMMQQIARGKETRP